MSNEKKPSFKLNSVDDLFTTQEMRDEAKLAKISEISVDLIDTFPDHPFKVLDDEDMMSLVESIKLNGVLTPAIVRKKEDGRYEMISGHRRLRASQLLELPTLRCEVVELSRDEATLYMVDSNLQRSKILPSEKAFAYKMRLDAMTRQGKRNDLTSAPVEQKSKGKSSRDILASEVGEGSEQVRRYIRLTELIPEILAYVDDGKIGMRPAVEISYLPKGLQRELLVSMEMEDCTPTHDQAIRMREMDKAGTLDAEKIGSIMMETKPNQRERIVLNAEKTKELLPKGLPIADREAYILKALKYYNKYLIKQLEERNHER